MNHTGAPRWADRVQQRFDAYGARHPEWVLMGPYIVYVLLLMLPGLVPAGLEPAAVAARGVLSLGVVWLFRRHLPPWGRAHWLLAIACGVLCAWGWILGQHVFDTVGLGGRLPGFPGEKTVVDPRTELGGSGLFWTTWTLRFVVAWTAVPVVEELFWRAFLLRAFVDWRHFERVPYGEFSLTAFLATSALSVGQHPDNWGVSILCWFVFNGLYYWKKSLLFLVIVHGVTNFALYLLVLRVKDWSF